MGDPVRTAERLRHGISLGAFEVSRRGALLSCSGASAKRDWEKPITPVLHALLQDGPYPRLTGRDPRWHTTDPATLNKVLSYELLGLDEKGTGAMLFGFWGGGGQETDPL